jgi:hypothetical protein
LEFQDFILETEEDEAYLEGIRSEFDYDDILTVVGMWWIWNLYLVDKVPKNLFSGYIKKGIRKGIKDGIRNSLKAVHGTSSPSSSSSSHSSSTSSYGRTLPDNRDPDEVEEAWRNLEKIAEWLNEDIMRQ